MSVVTAEDKLIWGMPSGTPLVCIRHMLDDGIGDRLFTAGRLYSVSSMHPIAVPAYVQIVNDFGQPVVLDGSQLQQHFERGTLLRQQQKGSGHA
ncbi:hypothetical protein NPS53_09080 [Pseudomonas putida]|uniref:hypothetical protein n=1 Tax=Pseudomonas putida TaxID=303 RepID=UPI0023644276|nr:hypothetical protein [Pseudomonas putida]MDD2139728.1 hypothetical protein [Pseudomonas putida]HDS1721652.1 hypothetical protein [Pseudomonas putida]